MRMLLTAFFLGLPLAAQDPEPARKHVTATVGQPAPTFRVNDETGAAVKVGGASKSWTVLAFYPKASTGG